MSVDDVTLISAPPLTEDGARIQPDRRIRFAAALVSTQFFLMFALLTPVVVALSIKVSLLAPQNSGTALSLILGVGSIMSVIAGPVFGNLSDRTRTRIGRRRPWLIGGGLVGAAALATIGATDSLLVVGVAFALVMLALNAAVAAVSGLYADRIPGEWQGRVGALLGVATNFGAIAGAAVATIFGTNLLLTFAVPGVAALVAVIVLSLLAKDSRDDARITEPFSLLGLIRGFGWPVRENRNFTVNFCSRFLIWLGYGVLISYEALLFIAHFGISLASVPGYMLAATGIAGIATLIGSFSFGWLTDKIDRRRNFVVLAGLLVAASLVLIGFAPSPEFVIAVGAVGGFGLGIYIAVDLSLAVRLIPDARNAGRYMGIVNMANTLPGALTPFLAPLLLGIGTTSAAPNFLALFLAGAAAVALGSGLMFATRGVR